MSIWKGYLAWLVIQIWPKNEKRKKKQYSSLYATTKNARTTGIPIHAAENVKRHSFGKQFLRKLKTVHSVTQNYD